MFMRLALGPMFNMKLEISVGKGILNLTFSESLEQIFDKY